MKKYPLIVILTHAALVLFAQSRDDVSIFLAPTTGGTEEQQAFFDENFKMELTGANYAVSGDQKSADYSIKLNITQEIEDSYDDMAGEIINVLSVSLIDNEDSREILQFSWTFQNLEEMYEWNLHLIYQAMANVPLTKLTAVPDTSHWRNKWLYLCGYGGLDLIFGFYDSGNEVSFQNREYTFYPGPLFGVGLEFQFLNFMSAEFEIFGSPYDIDAGHSAVMFGMPLLLKFPLKPSKHFMLEPYGGIQFNTGSQRSIIPPLVSWVGGFQYGIKAGERGAIVLDVRAVGDIGTTSLFPPAEAPHHASNPNPKTYKGIDRFQLHILVGFKVGFYNRNKDDTKNTRFDTFLANETEETEEIAGENFDYGNE
ncbi:MAG: hypothetical protein LBU19_04770 [Treponema sp.]|jgi:hypothetical protein|nr:hypothetical protein [Treponema sp.]